MEENNKTIISVTNTDGNKLTFEILKESSIYEYTDAFKLILKWLTFGDSLINEYIKEEDEDIDEGN